MKPNQENFERGASGLFVPRRGGLFYRSEKNWRAAIMASRLRATMFDGPFWQDTRTPFFVSNLGAITLLTTAKALYTAGQFPPLGNNYFGFPGKRLGIYMSGAITTAATPGNGSFDIYYGTGADANGVILASSAALALTAAQTNLTWWLELMIRCITTGATGTLEVSGRWGANPGVLAGSLQPATIPASAAAPSAAVDLTAALIPSVQFKRSGSTVETMDVRDMLVSSLN
jgi:hypothetical protein